MPERITDQLRRITRAQGGVEEAPPLAETIRETRAKKYGPLIALGMVILLAGVGWLIVRQMMEMSRIQDCAMSGRKNCAPISTDGTVN